MFGKYNLSLITLLALSGFVVSASLASAMVKDSDLDGLTDQGETEIYHTDPTKADTDGDGVSDGTEVLRGTNPLSASSTPLRALAERSPDNFFFRHSGLIISLAVGIFLALISLFNFFQKKSEAPRPAAPTSEV